MKKKMDVVTADDVLKAMEFMEHLTESISFQKTNRVLLPLVVEEALVNALEYGTKPEQLAVSIEWDVSDEYVRIAVQQVGSSFEVRPSTRVNMGTRGRGLQLILHIMDEVNVVETVHGTVVLQMRKYWGKSA